tara:strand:+ start:83 stop:661 length:579 start_codon:yes stop_codon:yes gene_type:complete
MPYTKDEKENLDFYIGFRDDLRYQYLNRLSGSAATNFRNPDNNILLSYEDIFTSEGLEKVKVADGIYKGYVTQDQIESSRTTTSEFLPIFDKGNMSADPVEREKGLLDKLIDRNITELSEDLIASSLPEGVGNGSVITNEDPTDQTRYLIEDNQKRKYNNLGEYYGMGKTVADLITLEESAITRIPDGEDID